MLSLTLSLLKHLKSSSSLPEQFLKDFEGYMAATYPPILVLMNINGLLVCKTEKKVNTKIGYTRAKSGNYVYLRPGHFEFMKKILNHPRVHFGWYSALKQKNSQKIIRFMFMEYVIRSDKEKIKVDLDQEYCDSAPEVTGDEWSFWIRNLNKVWQSE